MKLFAVLILLLPTFVYPQDEVYKKELPLNDENRIEFSEVVQFEGMTKDQIYAKAMAWFAESYRSANDVIQMDDKEAGVMIGKGLVRYNIDLGMDGALPFSLRHVIKIEVREGRAKITMNNLLIRLNMKIGGVEPQPEPAYNFMNDEILYKKNGKARKKPRLQKEHLFEFWTNTLNEIEKAVKENDSDSW